MGKKRGGNKPQQQHKPVEAAMPRSEEVAVVEEKDVLAASPDSIVEPTPVTKQPADLPEQQQENNVATSQEKEQQPSTPRADEELTPGGESPQGKKILAAAEVAEAPAVAEEENLAPVPSSEPEEKQQQEEEVLVEKKEIVLESPTSTVEEKPLVPSDSNSSESTTANTNATTTPAAEETTTTGTSTSSSRNQMINEHIDQFLALPIVEFVGLIVIKLAVAVVAFALRLRNKILGSELFAKVQQTAIVASALNLVDAKKIQQASVEGLDLLDSKVIVPLQLMDENTPQGKLFKGASVVVFDILADAQKQVAKKKDE